MVPAGDACPCCSTARRERGPPRAALLPRSFAGLLDELAAFDWQGEAERHVQKGASAMTTHLSKLLLYAFGTTGGNGKERGKEQGKGKNGDKEDRKGKEGSKENGKRKEDGKENGKQTGSSVGRGSQKADGSSGRGDASRADGARRDGERLDSEAVGEAADEALHEAALAAGEAGLRRLSSAGFERSYNAHVPGRVCLIFRQPGADAGGSAGGDAGASRGSDSSAGGDAVPSEGGNGSAGGDGGASVGGDGSAHSGDNEGMAAPAKDGLALVPCTHPAVRRLRVSSSMFADHFVDKPEVMAALAD